MPLLKRKPYELSSPPDDLNPKDLVFQVRITKEIFRDYQEYVNRINLYRQRVWTCKYTGKINLTYEEALLSEVKATEKVQQFPKEFMGPVLRLVQFSMVRLDELVSAILKNFKDRFVVDEEVLCVKESVTKPCRIVAVYENPDDGIHSYLVVWLDNDKNPIGSSLEEAKNLVRRKVPPFTRGLLKSFIRESVKNNASRNSLTPLVVLESLCHKHGITTNPPEELKKFFNKQEVNKKESNGVNKRSLVEVMEAEINLNKKPKMMDTELCNGENAHQKGKIMVQDTKTKTETTQVNKSKDNIAQQGKSKSKKSHEDKKANTKTIGEDESQAKTQPDKKDKTVRGDKSKAKAPQVDNKKEKMVQRDKRKAETLQEDNKKEKVVQGGKVKVETPQDDKNKAKTTILKDGNEANNGPVAKVVPIKYPIEDSLVQPSPDDPLLPNKPVPLSDFPLPMDCTGRLLMVWNFCTLFGKVIRLSPFPLDELAKALDCKDKDNILLNEAHHALIKLILSDPAIHEEFQEIRNPKTKVTIDAWKDEYCDLSKLEGFKSLVEHSMTINDGNYMLLEPSIKLDILCGLVDCALNSTGIREQLDIYIEEKQAIASQKRKEEMESSKMEKEAQEKLKQQGQNTGVSVTQLPVHEYDPRVAENVKNECSEESISEDGMDNEASNLEKNSMHFGGLSNGSQDNGNAEETLVASARSRQRLLKIRAELKQAEESMKERKRNEEQRKLQEVQRAKRVAVKERKLQERKIIELHKRQEHLDREIEKRVIRTNPLGRDKDYNRYWFFPRDGRIFVEDEKSTTWGYYAAKEELEALLRSLNTKGVRERALQRQLEKHYGKISESFQKRSKEIAQQRVTLDDTSIRRSLRGKTISQQTDYTYKNKYRN